MGEPAKTHRPGASQPENGGGPPPALNPRFARLLIRLYNRWQEDPTKWNPSKASE
jgi:hypothetical protein